MDKNTLIAVVLSVVVISVGFFIQAMLTAPDEEQVTARQQEALPAEAETAEQEEAVTEQQMEQQEEGVTTEGGAVTSRVVPYRDETKAEPVLQEINAETDVYDILLSTRGGVIKSLKLKEHLDKGDPAEMVFTGDTNRAAFSVSFDDSNHGESETLYYFRKRGDYVYEFSRTFQAPSADGTPGNLFTLIKTYTFKPEEYVIKLEITIENSVNEIPNLADNGSSYHLYYGPQLGPEFENLDPKKREFRRFYVYADGKRRTIKTSREGTAAVDERLLWAGLAGKYFAVVGVPDANQYEITFRSHSIPGIPQTGEIIFSRPPLQSSKNTDNFYFFIGPKLGKVLTRYNDPQKNGFELKDLNIDAVADRSKLLGWLESILKFFLVTFYKIVPNYGVAIIMLTILVKIVLFPITRKSYESTSKMQELSPKINELKKKYKDDPKKMNVEMSKIYKKEGVSPLGGCLPMLLQLPFFIALYGLLNTHFDLRGASFISPWITDLSAPESVWNFAPFQLPLLGWSDLRLLPIIFVGTQLISSKMMQTPNASSQGNMKIMTYALPIVFFFILYDVPSGLLLYWIVTNVLTVLQQKYIAKLKHSKKA
mgnify:CR=1 FL=1